MPHQRTLKSLLDDQSQTFKSLHNAPQSARNYLIRNGFAVQSHRDAILTPDRKPASSSSNSTLSPKPPALGRRAFDSPRQPQADGFTTADRGDIQVFSPTGTDIRRPITPEPPTPIPSVTSPVAQIEKSLWDPSNDAKRETMSLVGASVAKGRTQDHQTSALSHPRITNCKIGTIDNNLYPIEAIGARATTSNGADSVALGGSDRTHQSVLQGKLYVTGNERVLMPDAAAFRPPVQSDVEVKRDFRESPKRSPTLQSPLPDLKSPLKIDKQALNIAEPLPVQGANRRSVDFSVQVSTEDNSRSVAKSHHISSVSSLLHPPHPTSGPNYDDMQPPSMYTSYHPSAAPSRRGTALTVDSHQGPVPNEGSLSANLAYHLSTAIHLLRESKLSMDALNEPLKQQLSSLLKEMHGTEISNECDSVPPLTALHRPDTQPAYAQDDPSGEGTKPPTAEHSATMAPTADTDPIIMTQESPVTKESEIPLSFIQDLDSAGRSAAAPDMSSLCQALQVMEDFLQSTMLNNCQSMNLWRYDDKRLVSVDVHQNGAAIPVSKNDRIRNREVSSHHQSGSGASSVSTNMFMDQSLGSAEQSVASQVPLSEALEDIRQSFIKGRVVCTATHLVIPLPDNSERRVFRHWGVLELLPVKGSSFSRVYQDVLPRLTVFGHQLRTLVQHYDQLTKIAKTSEAMGTVVSIAHSLAHNDVLDESKLIHTILESARSVCEAERASLFTLSGDDGNGNWTELVARGQNGREFRVPRGKGVVGKVADTGIKMNIPDAQRSDLFFDSIDDKTGFVTRSILCVPVKFEGTLVGVAQLINKAGSQGAPSRGSTAGHEREGSASSSSSVPSEAGRRNSRRSQPIISGFTKDDEECFDNLMILVGLSLRSCTTENELTRERAKMEGLFASVLTLAQADLTDMGATKAQVLAAGRELASVFDGVYLLMVNKEHNKLELDPKIVSIADVTLPEAEGGGPILLAMEGISGHCVRTGELQFVKNFCDSSQFRSSSSTTPIPASRPGTSQNDGLVSGRSAFQSQISSATSSFVPYGQASLYDPAIDAVGCDPKQLISIMCIPISAGDEVIAVLQLVALDREPFASSPTDVPPALSMMGFGSISAQFAMSMRGFSDVINMSNTGDIIVSKLIDDKAKTHPSPEFISLMKGFALFAGIWLRNADLMAFTIRASKAATRLTEFTPAVSKKESNLVAGTDPLLGKSTVNPSEVQVLLKYPIPQEFAELMTTPNFDIWSLRRRYDNPSTLASSIVLKLILQTNLPKEFGCKEETLAAFIIACRNKYRSVPYHSFYHAVDVLQTMYTFLYTGKACHKLSRLEQFVMLIVALTHDLDHMGLNNSYYMKTESPLGILNAAGGNTSVLEVHHCNLAIDILSHQDCNVFEGLRKEDLQAAYRLLIEAILQTDMAKHGETVNHLKTFEPTSFDFTSEEHRRFAAITLMKAADISNVTKPFAISKQWGRAVVEEFSQQGDKEKSQGITDVLPAFDREKNADLAKSQIGFMDFVTLPFYTLVVEHLFPDMIFALNQLKSNRETWASQPQESPMSKVTDS